MELSLTGDKLRSFIESVTHLSWILKNSKGFPGKRKSKPKKNYSKSVKTSDAQDTWSTEYEREV